MKSKILLVLSTLFLLTGCAENEPYNPSHGGKYNPEDDPVIQPVATGLGLITAPDSIYVGDRLNPSDINVLVLYSDESIKQVHPDTVSVDTSVAGEVEGNITYKEFSGTFKINVVEKEVKPEPVKEIASLGQVIAPKSIKLNEVLPFDEVSVVVNYTDSTTELVHPTSMILDNSKVGTTVATLGYGGLITQFEIEIEDIDPTIEIVDITAEVLVDSIYVNEHLALNDVLLSIDYSNETKGYANPEEIVLDSSSSGEICGVAKYLGNEIEIKVTVIDAPEVKTIVDLGRVDAPTSILIGEVIKLEDVTVVVNYSDETSESVHPTSIKLDNTKAGNITAVIGYEGKITTFVVAVIDPNPSAILTGISDASTAKNIFQGEELSLNTITVAAHYSDGTSRFVNPTSVDLDTSNLGLTTGVAHYGGFDAEFSITVLEKKDEQEVKSIEILECPETIAQGDTLSLTDMLIKVTYTDNTSATLNPTAIKLDTSKLGSVTGAYGYGSIVDTFTITVVEKQDEIKIVSLGAVSAPDTIKKDQVLATKDVTVVVNYSNGTSENVNPTSISLNTSTVGETQGSVTYKGFTASFTIQVITTSDLVVEQVLVNSVDKDPIYVDDVWTTDDITLYILYNDGSEDYVHPKNKEDIVADTSEAGDQEGIVYYDELFAEFTYTVIAKEEEEEETIPCTYNIYFSYSQTTTYQLTDKGYKDVDSPLISFVWKDMLKPYGSVPEAIRSDSDPTKIDANKFLALGQAQGYVVDPAYPTFIGLSNHGLCLSDDDLWDFTKDKKQQAVINLYGIWVSK